MPRRCGSLNMTIYCILTCMRMGKTSTLAEGPYAEITKNDTLLGEVAGVPYKSSLSETS